MALDEKWLKLANYMAYRPETVKELKKQIKRVKKVKIDAYCWVCDKCAKMIISEYETRIIQQIFAHYAKHKRKELLEKVKKQNAKSNV